MQVEKTTGLFMVQRVSADQFLGTVACLINGQDAGWTSGLVDTATDGWSFLASNEVGLSLTADMDMALRFASILMVTSTQGLAFSNGPRDLDAVEGCAIRDGRSRLISIKVPKAATVKALDAEEGEVAFRVAPELARAVAMKVYEIAAQMWTMD